MNNGRQQSGRSTHLTTSIFTRADDEMLNVEELHCTVSSAEKSDRIRASPHIPFKGWVRTSSRLSSMHHASHEQEHDHSKNQCKTWHWCSIPKKDESTSRTATPAAWCFGDRSYVSIKYQGEDRGANLQQDTSNVVARAHPVNSVSARVMMDDHRSGRAGTVRPKGKHIQRKNPPRAVIAVNSGDTETPSNSVVQIWWKYTPG